MRFDRLKVFFNAIDSFILVVSAVLMTAAGCAGDPREDTGFSVSGFFSSERSVSEGMSVIEGAGWTAVKSSVSEGGPIPAVTATINGDGDLLGDHGSSDLKNPGVEASLVGSSHDPIRFRSGLPQSVSGFFRLNDITLAEPNGKQDAVGIDGKGTLFLLRPEAQKGWMEDAVAGFYAVLSNGEIFNPVEDRDAVGALGWSKDSSTIFFFVSRGHKGKGFTYREVGEILRALGAENALAMDGGGSVRLVWREGEDIISFPDKPLYRAVPNRLVFIRR